MVTFKLHLKLIALQLLCILHSILTVVCSAFFLYQLYFLVKSNIQTKSFGSATDYILPVALVVAIVVLTVFKRELTTNRDNVQQHIKLIQDKRTADANRHLKQQALKEELRQKHYFRQADQSISEELQQNSAIHEENVRRKFNVTKVSADPEAELRKLIGLAEAKAKVEEYKFELAYEKQYGKVGDTKTPHMCFVGNPGTGKTTIGRIMAGILYREKRIPKNKYVEVNGNDLIGEYMGQTAPIVREAFEQAAGGVLFIDEAYALSQSVGGSGHAGYGNEAVTQLLSLLENNKDGTVVIFAGYKSDMEQFFKMNPGLPSRVPKEIEFPDYSPLELCQILVIKLKSMRTPHDITRDALEAIYGIVKQKKLICMDIESPFGNARYISNLADAIHSKHATNHGKGLVKDQTICLVDIDRESLLKLN